MALTRLTIEDYGQLEPTRVAGLRSGAIETQCKIANTDTDTYEVGMLVTVDKANGTIAKATTATGINLPVALLYNSEENYNQLAPQRRKFSMKAGDYGRAVFLQTGDVFVTNTIAYDTTEFTTTTAFWTAIAGTATTAVYATYSTNGAVTCTTSAPTDGPVITVVGKTDNADGSDAVKFFVKEG